MSVKEHQPSWWARYVARSYARFLMWLGEVLVGRGNAGKLGRFSRALRLVATGFIISSIVAGIIVSSIMSAGGLLPVWAYMTASGFAFLNSLGIVLGSAANQMKIEQHYDALADSYHLNNETIPHGVEEYKERELQLYHLMLARRAHDANGILGTIVSMVLFLGSVASSVFTGGTSAILFSVSRGSSMLSALFAPLTHWYRMKVHKSLLLTQQKKYESEIAKTNKEDAKKFQQWTQLICPRARNDNTSQVYRNYLFRFLMEHKPYLTENSFSALRVYTAKLLDRNDKIQRRAVSLIDMDCRYQSYEYYTFKRRLAFLDAMTVIEAIWFEKITDDKQPQEYKRELHRQIRIAIVNRAGLSPQCQKTHMLHFYCYRVLFNRFDNAACLAQQSDSVTHSIAESLIPYVKNRSGFGKRKGYEVLLGTRTKLDEELISNKFVDAHHPHGNPLIIRQHLSALANEITKGVSGRCPSMRPHCPHRVSPAALIKKIPPKSTEERLFANLAPQNGA